MLENHQIELLKTLSNLVGVSGHEEQILQFVSEQLPFCRKEQDKLGSGLFSLGEGDLSIMFATHMDEVGFVVSSINERGYVSIQPVGNMWAHTLSLSSLFANNMGQYPLSAFAPIRQARTSPQALRCCNNGCMHTRMFTLPSSCQALLPLIKTLAQATIPTIQGSKSSA